MDTKRDDHSPEQRQAEEQLRQVWTGVEAFQADFATRLAGYRKERAWQVMLAIRKSYHLIVRRGPLRFLRWTLGGDARLDEFEPAFPDLATYLPERRLLNAPAPIRDEPVPPPRTNAPLVSILVVTYDSREYLEPFLDSIRRNTSYPNYELIAVDNHSADGSAAELERHAQADPRIRVERLSRNLGFAGGNNLAARMARGEFLALLNPDTIVTSGWLERLLRPLEEDAAVGLVGPVSNFSGNETKVNAHYRSPAGLETFAFDRARTKRGETSSVEVVPLFCGLLRRSVWEEMGGLDETFEIGTFEDDDFCLRLRNAGYRIVTAEDCFIHHFGHGSFSKLKPEEFERIFESNRRRFESKWKTVWRPHRTRPGVRSVSEDIRLTVSEFCCGEARGD